MGEVVSIEEYRRARAGRGAVASAAGGDDAAVTRLEQAVRALESALEGAVGAGDLDEPAVRRELLAVSGAVAVGRYVLAAERTERLITRLRGR
jgi:hypothetical protein